MDIGGGVMSMTSTILAVLLALVFFSLGTAKILALPLMRERAAEVGFTVGAYRRIGALEVAGAIALLIGLVQPLIGGLAGVGLLLLLGGALVAHLRNGDGPQKFAPAVVCGLLVANHLIVHFGATR
jgi:DoxX-like family